MKNLAGILTIKCDVSNKLLCAKDRVLDPGTKKKWPTPLTLTLSVRCILEAR